MAKKKNQSFFGPVSSDSLVHLQSVNNLARHVAQEPPSPRVEALFDESDIQNLTIDAQKEKTGFGLEAIADIHQHTAGLFGETINTIYECKEEIHNKEAQAIADEFSARLISLYGRQTLASVEVSGKAIGFEINRSLYVPPPAPPPQRGFLARLFGG